VIGGLASVVTSQTFDLVLLVVNLVRRIASDTGLRVMTLFLAQTLDLATFSVMVARHGVGAEANPIVVDLFDSFGMPAVVIVKLVLITLVAALALAASGKGSRRLWAMVGGLPLAVAIAAGLIGGITNAATYLA
jgi:hypothetical protein